MVEDYSIIKHCKRLDQVENGKVLSSIVGHLGISIFYTYSLTPHIKSVDCPIEFSKFRPGQTRVDRNEKQVFKTTFRFSCDLPSSFHCACHIHSPPHKINIIAARGMAQNHHHLSLLTTQLLIFAHHTTPKRGTEPTVVKTCHHDDSLSSIKHPHYITSNPSIQSTWRAYLLDLGMVPIPVRDGS